MRAAALSLGRVIVPFARLTDTTRIDDANRSASHGESSAVPASADAERRAPNGSPGAGGASVSGSADEVKLEELRAIATQRMAKQRMYEEYVKARPAAAGGGARMSVFGENENETAKKTSDAAASSLG